MQLVKVNEYSTMLNGIRNGNRHAILKFHGSHCYRSKQFKDRLIKRVDLQIDVYEIDFFEHRDISRLLGVEIIPTALLLENGIPISRMDGLYGADDFLDFVADVVLHGKNPL
jgi:thioredoxin-like negative regulator of GroEL